MPRAKSDTVKSSAELDAEIQEMQKKLAEKQRASKAAKKREEAEAKQARAIEEAKFNRDFVEAAKTIRLSDYEDNGQTIYELIRAIIRPPEGQEPVQDIDVPEVDFSRAYYTGPSLSDLMQRQSQGGGGDGGA